MGRSLFYLSEVHTGRHKISAARDGPAFEMVLGHLPLWSISLEGAVLVYPVTSVRCTRFFKACIGGLGSSLRCKHVKLWLLTSWLLPRRHLCVCASPQHVILLVAATAIWGTSVTVCPVRSLQEKVSGPRSGSPVQGATVCNAANESSPRGITRRGRTSTCHSSPTHKFQPGSLSLVCLL